MAKQKCIAAAIAVEERAARLLELVTMCDDLAGSEPPGWLLVWGREVLALHTEVNELGTLVRGRK